MPASHPTAPTRVMHIAAPARAPSGARVPTAVEWEEELPTGGRELSIWIMVRWDMGDKWGFGNVSLITRIECAKLAFCRKRHSAKVDF